MIRRIIEIVVGVIIAVSLFFRYSSEGESKLFIWYALTPEVLQAIVWFALFFVAGRLIFGKYKDYSKFFYNLIVKLFGEPKGKQGN